MPRTHIQLTETLAEYLRQISLREPDVLRRLRDETAKLPHGGMQITPEQGQFMRLLVKLIGARKTFEVGVFTGYSSTSVALGLPADGRLIACDVSAEWTTIARRYWREAGVESRIDLRLGPALPTLNKLVADGEAGTFDFAFIDADKPTYRDYYERALVLVRIGGLIAIDNVLWSGRVTDPAYTDPDTQAIREFNTIVAADSRVMVSMLPIGDGLTLVLKN
jgi:predicted O-methyltransferase YrrM